MSDAQNELIQYRLNYEGELSEAIRKLRTLIAKVQQQRVCNGIQAGGVT